MTGSSKDGENNPFSHTNGWCGLESRACLTFACSIPAGIIFVIIVFYAAVKQARRRRRRIQALLSSGRTGIISPVVVVPIVLQDELENEHEHEADNQPPNDPPPSYEE